MHWLKFNSSCALLCLTGLTAGASDEPTLCTAVSAREAVSMVNQWREQVQPCSAEAGAAGPLVWGAGLQAVARQQTLWLARHGRLAHRGEHGEDLAQRARDSGYRFARITENLAHGQRRLSQTLAGWQASPGHCQNLHDSRVSEMALACAPAADGRLMWVLVMAHPL